MFLSLKDRSVVDKINQAPSDLKGAIFVKKKGAL